jgi:AbiV family abortive infection protein
MRAKAIRDLDQLADEQLFTQLSAGMTYCLKNALTLWRDAVVLRRAHRAQAFRITEFFIAEEAAKFHILLDAARCPRQGGRLSRQLGYFVQHLPKGIYAEYYQWAFHTLDGAERFIDKHYRPTYYLDGPNDVDWIFANDILRRREEAIYVDYITRDTGSYWHHPDLRLLGLLLSPTMPDVLKVGLALHHAGVTTPSALALVAQHWRTIDPRAINTTPELWQANQTTLSMIEDAGLLRHRSERKYRTILSDWRLPLYDLDLSPINIDQNTLRTIQRRGTPWDYW